MRLITLLLAGCVSAASAAPAPVPSNRVASLFFSQDFINTLISEKVKSDMFKDVSIALDASSGTIALRGIVKVPVEELRAINLDEKLSSFRFQVTIKPKTTKKGHLVLIFPLDQTYFYPAESKDPEHERVIVPVQLLSVALASARGYLAALSGDFSGFDKQERRLKGQIAELDHELKKAAPADVQGLKDDREAARLQLEAIPIERRQMQEVAKAFENMVGFAGEKELNLNDELGSRRNALVLRIPLSQFAPYLVGIDLGGVRILHDSKDGGGQNYLGIDVNAQLAVAPAPPVFSTATAREPLKIAPYVVIRLNQALFESTEVLASEQKSMGSQMRSFALKFHDDGLHVRGEWKSPLLVHIPFRTVIDFVWTAPDQFELRVRRVKVAGLDIEAVSGLILELAKKRLADSMKGICTFQYVGEERDGSRALRVNVDMHALIPAFPLLHLTGIDTRDNELLLKTGRL
ncbi:MAG TPA: hypothetical protein VN915_14450 [Elusimicrobiota bacterium]|nr:hypothetical protein [Elusimicrobiota bacterium]